MGNSGVSRRALLSAGLALVVAGPAAASGGLPPVTAWRDPGCGCCEGWAKRMTEAGFAVTMRDDPDLAGRRADHGVPVDLGGCHLALVDGYVIDGHVPPADVLRLLGEKPKVIGLAVPGMPMGSPGMEGGFTEPYDVLAFAADGSRTVYARH